MIIKIIAMNQRDLLTMYHNTLLALSETEIEADVLLCSDELACQSYRLQRTPALVIDDIVMTQGYISDKKDLKLFFQQQKALV